MKYAELQLNEEAGNWNVFYFDHIPYSKVMGVAVASGVASVGTENQDWHI